MLEGHGEFLCGRGGCGNGERATGKKQEFRANPSMNPPMNLRPPSCDAARFIDRFLCKLLRLSIYLFIQISRFATVDTACLGRLPPLATGSVRHDCVPTARRVKLPSQGGSDCHSPQTTRSDASRGVRPLRPRIGIRA